MRVIAIYTLALLIFSCRPNATGVPQSEEVSNGIDNSLLSILKQKYEVDQDIQYSITPDLLDHVRDSLHNRKDEIFSDNCNWAKEVFEQRGFLGYSDVGEDGSYIFWIIVQHCDHNPAFQKEVLKAMKAHVDVGNANGKDYAYLVDRVKVNNGEKQIYGTQLIYSDDFWVSPRPLEDSIDVDQRRIAVGLIPLKEYLNEVMQMNYEMNKSVYEQRGLDGPNQY